MKLTLLPMILLIACSGGGGGGSKKVVNDTHYKIVYSYPDNTLTPGQGELQVSPNGGKCVDDKGVEVSLSFCGVDEDYDFSTGDRITHKSPAGLITITIPNSDPSSITIEIEEGKRYVDLTDEEKADKVRDLISCQAGYEFTFRGTCETPDFTFRYGAFPENNMSPCSGSRIVTRTYSCVSNITGIGTDMSNCSELTPEDSTTQFSPEGSSTETLPNGDVSLISCQVGKTAMDVGNGSTVIASISCGPDRYKNGNFCVGNSYIAGDFVYPENTLEIGEGTREVKAIAFSKCTRERDNASVDLSNCTMPSPTPKTIQMSPAGNKNVTVADVTYIYNYSEGDAIGSVIDIASCNNPNQFKVGVGNNASCVSNARTAKNFIFPINDMGPGDGIRTVSATGFSVCQRQYDGALLDVSQCTMPTPIPTEIQLSPAGSLDSTNGDGDYIRRTFALGQTIAHTTEVLSCGNDDYHVEGTGNSSHCALDTFVASNFIFPPNTLQPGQGTRVVEANNFSICTNTTKSRSEPLGKCTMPTPIPTEIHLSPAGNMDVTVANAVGGKVTIEVSAGLDFEALPASTKLSMIDPVLSCASNFRKANGACLANIKEVYAGNSHTCALTESGNVKCWGSNYYGQLGDGTGMDSLTPVEVAGLSSVTKLDVYGDTNCAIVGGTLGCWGFNNNMAIMGTIQSYVRSPFNMPSIGSGVTDVSIGANHVCAVLSGSVKCWGTNHAGQLGGLPVDSGVNIITVSGLSGVTSVKVGNDFSCALLSNGSVRCWGSNSWGQLGIGNSGTYSASPVTPIGLTSGVSQLATGDSHACALTTAGTVRCWGSRGNGQVGDNLTGFAETPVQVATGMKSIFVRSSSSCAVTNEDDLRCWGRDYGNYGLSSTNIKTPTAVSTPGLTKFVSISWDHLCLVLIDGSVSCRNQNDKGQLGDGTTTNSTSFVSVHTDLYK